jgi:hypothetical protein
VRVAVTLRLDPGRINAVINQVLLHALGAPTRQKEVVYIAFAHVRVNLDVHEANVGALMEHTYDGIEHWLRRILDDVRVGLEVDRRSDGNLVLVHAREWTALLPAWSLREVWALVLAIH